MIGVTAVTEACCQAVLQSGTEQWGMRFALTSVAVHMCWVTADLYGQQIFIGVIAVTQGCCQAVLQSSTEQWGMQVALTSGAIFCAQPMFLVCLGLIYVHLVFYGCLLPV